MGVAAGGGRGSALENCTVKSDDRGCQNPPDQTPRAAPDGDERVFEPGTDRLGPALRQEQQAHFEQNAEDKERQDCGNQHLKQSSISHDNLQFSSSDNIILLTKSQ